MMPLKGRFIDDYGQVVFDDDGVMELLYTGRKLTDIVVSINMDETNHDGIFEYCNTCLEQGKDIPFRLYEQPVDDLSQRSHNWFITDEYYFMDIEEYLISKCNTDIERNRVLTELKRFEQRGITVVLKYMKYLVDTMRSNGILWGVGRGSSVASYCLYLIGIHRINPLEHDLNIEEFLK